MDISEISARTTILPTSTRQPQAAPSQQARGMNGTQPPVASLTENGASREGLEDAVKKVQEFVNFAASDIEFSIDEDSGQTVVKIIDRATEEVIRQMPSEDMLDLSKALGKLQGLLLKQEA